MSQILIWNQTKTQEEVIHIYLAHFFIFQCFVFFCPAYILFLQ